MEVWVVSKLDLDEFEVMAVFSSEQLSEDYIQGHPHPGPFDVEVFKLDDATGPLKLVT